MNYVCAASPRDMEIFLEKVAGELSAVGAEVYMDLYTDEPLNDEAARESFEEMVAVARGRKYASLGKRRFRRPDPLMGVELDLTLDEHVTHFSRLAHRVMNTEVWHDGRQLFGTVESSHRVWVDLPGESLERALSAAIAEGASVEVRADG